MPQPSRRTSIAPRETNVETVTSNQPPEKRVSRRMTLGGNARILSSGTSTQLPPQVRRSSRLSVAPINDQENAQPSNIFSKGMRSIENFIRGDSSNCDNASSEDLTKISTKAHKSKPVPTALRTQERAQVLRASNRRKSISDGNVKVELWKDI